MWGRILHGGIIIGIWLTREFSICEISYICHQKLYQQLYGNQPRLLKQQNHGLVEVCCLRCSNWTPWHKNYIWVVFIFVVIIVIWKGNSLYVFKLFKKESWNDSLYCLKIWVQNFPEKLYFFRSTWYLSWHSELADIFF